MGFVGQAGEGSRPLLSELPAHRGRIANRQIGIGTSWVLHLNTVWHHSANIDSLWESVTQRTPFVSKFHFPLSSLKPFEKRSVALKIVSILAGICLRYAQSKVVIFLYDHGAMKEKKSGGQARFFFI